MTTPLHAVDNFYLRRLIGSLAPDNGTKIVKQVMDGVRMDEAKASPLRVAEVAYMEDDDNEH